MQQSNNNGTRFRVNKVPENLSMFNEDDISSNNDDVPTIDIIDTKKWLSMREASRILQCSHGNIYYLKMRGRIQFIKFHSILLFDSDSLLKYLIYKKPRTKRARD